MKRFFVFLIGLLFMAGGVSAQNIAYVDVQKVMNQSKKGQAFKKEIKDKVEYYQKNFPR